MAAATSRRCWRRSKRRPSSIHLLIYGFQPGEIGSTFRDALVARAQAGVEVRLAVDAVGSQIDFGSKALYAELVAAGIAVVANDGLVPDRDGLLGARRFDWHMDDSSTSIIARC